jgi:hypothetical protein
MMALFQENQLTLNLVIYDLLCGIDLKIIKLGGKG